jgi:DNA-binding GntR family transcriptional regulator
VEAPVLRALRFCYDAALELIEYVILISSGEKFTFFAGRQYFGG